ncbi:transposable element Tc1 transposase [Trichonephila clavipes]|nr:transposable element Tc1 transposase [Trichonephila clavipes]
MIVGVVVSKRPGSEWSRSTTEREDHCIRRTDVAPRTASAAEIRAAVGTTVTHRTPELIGGWRRYLLFSDESRFCLGASDGRVLVRRPGECLQPNCLPPKHTGPTPRVMVWGEISYESRSPLVVITNTLTANLYVGVCSATRGLLATDHVILNHGQVTWTTPELAPPSPNYHTTPHQREDVSALDRFNVHRCPTRRVFSGTGLEPVTKQATVRYLYHSATAATNFWEKDSPSI